MHVTEAHAGFEPVLPERGEGKPHSGSEGRIPPDSDLNPHLRAVLERLKGVIRSVAGDPGELLRTKWSEYELLAEWRAERAPVDDEHLVASQAMLVVGLVLRDVAAAIEVDWAEEVDGRRGASAAPDDAAFMANDTEFHLSLARAAHSHYYAEGSSGCGSS